MSLAELWMPGIESTSHLVALCALHIMALGVLISFVVIMSSILGNGKQGATPLPHPVEDDQHDDFTL